VSVKLEKEITRETNLRCKGRKIMMTLGPSAITFWLKGKRETFTLTLEEAFTRSTFGMERAVIEQARAPGRDPMLVTPRVEQQVDVAALEQCMKDLNNAR